MRALRTIHCANSEWHRDFDELFTAHTRDAHCNRSTFHIASSAQLSVKSVAMTTLTSEFDYTLSRKRRTAGQRLLQATEPNGQEFLLCGWCPLVTRLDFARAVGGHDPLVNGKRRIRNSDRIDSCPVELRPSVPVNVTGFLPGCFSTCQSLIITSMIDRQYLTSNSPVSCLHIQMLNPWLRVSKLPSKCVPTIMISLRVPSIMINNVHQVWEPYLERFANFVSL